MPIFGLHPAGLLETIFEEIGIAVAVVDREQNVIFANRTAVDLLGESADKPIAFRELRAKYHVPEVLYGERVRLPPMVSSFEA